MDLTERERDFLNRVMRNERLRLADYEEDKIRQKMRKAGYCEVIMNPRRWAITTEGVKILTSYGQWS